MKVHCLEPHEFESLAPDAHKIAFGDTRPLNINRHTHVLVIADQDVLYGYATLIEMDANSVYIQLGGAFPSCRGTPLSKAGFRMMMDFLRENYTTISARILNTNVPMIKFALSEGMIINGCIFHECQTYLHVTYSAPGN